MTENHADYLARCANEALGDADKILAESKTKPESRELAALENQRALVLAVLSLGERMELLGDQLHDLNDSVRPGAMAAAVDQALDQTAAEVNLRSWGRRRR